MGQLESKSLNQSDDEKQFQSLKTRHRSNSNSSNNGISSTTTTTTTTTTSNFLGHGLFHSSGLSEGMESFEESLLIPPPQQSELVNSSDFLNMLGSNVLDHVNEVGSSTGASIYSTTAASQPYQRYKLVLLGCGGSGKTTLSKLLKIHSCHYRITNNDVTNYRNLVMKNVLQSFIVLMTIKKTFFPSIEFIHEESRAIYDKLSRIMALELEKHFALTNYVQPEALMEMWHSEPLLQLCHFFSNVAQKYIKTEPTTSAFHAMLEREVIPHISIENLPLLLNHLKEVSGFAAESSNEFVNDTDEHLITRLILNSYIKTTGIVSLYSKSDMESKYENIELFDTGGQRNERKKWKVFTSNTVPVDGIVYLVALSEFNLSCYEDDATNRMIESLTLFEEIVNKKEFETVPIYLVFTKKNILDFKLRMFDLTRAPLTSLPDDLKINYLEHPVVQPLYSMLKVESVSSFTQRELNLCSFFCSNPNYHPKQLIDMIKTQQPPKDFNNAEEHKNFVDKNIKYITDLYFNKITHAGRKEQIMESYKIVDLDEMEDSVKVMQDIFKRVQLE